MYLFKFSIIFVNNIIRFAKAIQSDKECKLFDTTGVKIIAYICLAVGATLVYSSMYVLGIIGTYLGKFEIIIIIIFC